MIFRQRCEHVFEVLEVYDKMDGKSHYYRNLKLLVHLAL